MQPEAWGKRQMTDEPEKMAERLEDIASPDYPDIRAEAAAMIRKLAAENEALEKQQRDRRIEITRLRDQKAKLVEIVSNYERMLSSEGKDYIGLRGGPSLNERARAAIEEMKNDN
jgi:tRNA A37 threonylcarbamoyltransferase TsaD